MTNAGAPAASGDTAPPAAVCRFCVIGPGAIGSLVAARLTEVGNTVCLLDHRPERAGQLGRRGITIEGDGPIRTVRPAVTCDPAITATVEFVIICVKAFNTADVCRQLAPHIKTNTALLSLQNGLGNIEQLMQLGTGDVLAGATNMGVRLLAPGQVLCTGAGITWIAAARGDSAAGRLIPLLRHAGIDARPHPDLQVMLWTKLIINAAINPLTARFGFCNGELLAHPVAAPLARQIVAEATAVANAAGIPLSEAQMQAAMEDVCRRTARNRSSMLCDVEAGRPLELQAITGSIVRQADTLGIAVPVNREILASF